MINPNRMPDDLDGSEAFVIMFVVMLAITLGLRFLGVLV